MGLTELKIAALKYGWTYLRYDYDKEVVLLRHKQSGAIYEFGHKSFLNVLSPDLVEWRFFQLCQITQGIVYPTTWDDEELEEA